MSASNKQGQSQHQAATAIPGARSTLFGIAAMSGVVNLLSLTSPIFMLQVYDRVLSSRSVSTLVGLAVLAACLYLIQAVLDILRARVLVRIGEAFDLRLSSRVHDAVVLLPLLTRMPGDGQQPLRDLDNVRSFVSGNGPTAFFDLPWMPLYLGICFVFHFWIGMTALVGSILLVGLSLLTHALSQGPIRDVLTHGMSRNVQMEAARRNAETVRAMGLGGRLAARWQQANLAHLDANRRASDISGGLGSFTKSLRMALQSAILGVGAYLVIQQETSAGVMIASSIMMGRALAPVELAIASWKPFLTARQSWRRLKDLLGQMPEQRPLTALPPPTGELRVEGLAIVPPGEKRPTVSGVQFALPAGSALGVLGPSGSGKSTLARVLVGAWLPANGKVRLDGAALDQWDPQVLGRDIGYLPQGVELFDGTIAENIARFEPNPATDDIVAAAKAAGVHDLIVSFDAGYETRIGEAGSGLSAGQRQRIGLARALYRDPFLVVLDEPNSNLDAAGEAAVIQAIASVRARRGIAIVVAHRPSAIAAVDHVLLMEGGRMRAFGPRDEVLPKILQRPSGQPGASQAAARSLNPLRVVATTDQPDANEATDKEPVDD